MFHNTTHETGQLLIEYENKTKSQEDLILDLFRRVQGALFTPFQVKSFMDFTTGKDIPITSIRRALSNLTSQGLLIRTKLKTREKYNRPNYYWKLNTQTLK